MTQLSSMAGLDGWRNNSTSTAKSAIPNESEGRWDPATVIGLKTSDKVLVIGNPAFMPWLTEIARDITSIRKLSDISSLVKGDQRFDRIVLPRENNLSTDFVPLISELLTSDGLFVMFPPDNGWSMDQVMDFYFPDCRSWHLSTQFGDVIICDIKGISWRTIHV